MADEGLTCDEEVIRPDPLNGTISSTRIEPLLGRIREDPFYTYPVPFHPLFPKLIDYCKFQHLRRDSKSVLTTYRAMVSYTKRTSLG